MKPALLAAGALAAATVLAVVVTTQQPSPAAAPAPLAAPAAAPTLPPAPVPAGAAAQPEGGAGRLTCNFPVGAQLAYRVKSESSTPLTLPGAPAGRTLDATVDGVLRLRALRASVDGAVLLARFEQLVVHAPGVEASQLAPPFLVEVARDCRLIQFARASGTAREAARNQQALTWGALFATGGAFLGEDAMGAFEASVQRSPDGARVERLHTRYASLWQSDAKDVPATGLAAVELGEGPWFERLTARTALSVEGGTSSTALELTRVEASPRLTEEVAEADFIWEDLLPQRLGRAHAPRPFNKYDRERQEKVRPLSLEQALAQFDARAAGDTGLQDTWPELSAWFEVHPEGIGQALSRLAAGQLPATSVAPLYTAIGKARVPQAREALLTIRRDASQTPMDRVRATFNLLGREDVGRPLAVELSAEATASLSELEHRENFLRGEALLALGMMAGLGGDPGVEAVAAQTLRTVLTTAPVDSQVSHSALKALGNVGDAQLLPLIAPAQASSDIHTRIAAAHAFRRMPPQQTEAAALAWLEREVHPFVKRQLYITIRRQYFDAQVAPSEAMTRQAMADLAVTTAPIDRKTIIRFLAKSSLVQTPELRRFLVAQAKKERDTGILNAFTDILTPAEISEVLR